METYYLVWGNPRDPGQFVAYRRDLSAPEVRLNPDTQYVHLEVGPIPLSGPVITTADESVVVLVDQAIPDWLEPGFMGAWGWAGTVEVPRAARYPFQVDVLVLAMNWAGGLEGWSSSQWFDAAVRPLQRVELRVASDSQERFAARILETGVDQHGVSFVVAYVPDRPALDAADLDHHGWRREPWVRIRRKAWLDLAALSEGVEVEVVTALRSPIITNVVFHNLANVDDETYAYLPRDVRDAIEAALPDSGLGLSGN